MQQAVFATGDFFNISAAPVLPDLAEGCELQIDCSAAQGIPASDYVVVLILLFLSAMFSGLTLGLMSLDLIGLEIVVKAGSSPDASQSMKNDAEYAKKIVPIRKHGNLLLCTLLLGNVFVNSLNAIYLGKMFSGAVGAVLATALITIFGEIVPQALFQRHALYLGSRPIVIMIVKGFIFATYLGAFPCAFILDRVMGKEIGTIYNKQELRSMIEVYSQQDESTQNQAGLRTDDRTLISGAISFSNKTVADVQTKIEDIFMLHIDTRLTFDEIASIYLKGRSRVPVYEGDPASPPQTRKFSGVLLLKNLIILDTSITVTVREILDIYPVTLHTLYDDTTLDVALNQFQANKSHISLVQHIVNTDPDRDPYPVTTGVVTMEDLIEELIGEEIEDETDASLSPQPKKLAASGAQLFSARKRRESISQQTITQQAQFLNYITEKRQSPSSNVGSETVLVVCATLRAKHPDVFGALKFGDGALEAYVQGCRVAVFDAGSAAASVAFPHVLVEYERSVAAPFIVLQGALQGEMGREKFPVELTTFQTFGLSALQQQVYVSDSRIIATGKPPAKILFFDVEAYRKHSIM